MLARHQLGGITFLGDLESLHSLPLFLSSVIGPKKRTLLTTFSETNGTKAYMLKKMVLGWGVDPEIQPSSISP